MPLTIQTSELKRILKLLSVVNNKSDDNVVLLFFGKDSGYGLAEDSELNILIETRIASEDDTDYMLLVNGRKLLSVLSGIGKEVTISVLNNTMLVESAKAKFELPLINADKAPHMIKRSIDDLFTVSLPGFKDRLSYAAMVSDDNEEYAFCGAVQFVPKMGNNYFVGTDGSRIAIANFGKDFNEVELSIPYRAAKIVRELKGEKLMVSQDETTLFFRAEDVTVAAKKLVQKFPDFFTYIPQESTVSVEVEAEVFRNSLQSVVPMVDPDTNRVEITFTESLASIKVQSNEGKASDTINVLTGFDDPLADIEFVTVAVNLRFLLDYLTKVSGPVNILIKDAKTPLHLVSGETQYVLATLS